VPSASAPSPPRPLLVRPRRWLACALLTAGLAGLLAGCGSGNTSGTSADPASAVPASAVLYAGATVRPTGAQKTDALAAGKALTHQADPYLRLLAALQTPGSPTLNFSRDVAPWLGPHAGVFLSSLGSSGALSSLLQQGLLGGSSQGQFAFGAGAAQGAIVLDTSNTGRARSFLSAQAAHAGAHATSYRGVSYQLTSGGVALGLVDRFVVIGSESGMHSVIETTQGASSLAHASGYAKLLAVAPSEALAHLYTSPTNASAAGSGGASPSGDAAGEGLASVLGVLAGAHEANVSLVTSPTSLALDADTLTSSAQAGGLLATDPESAQALSELPGESWLAIGLGHVGRTLNQDAQDLQGLASLGGSLTGSGQEASAGLSIGGLLQALLTPLRALGANNAQAKHDFASWMGSAGIFASGSNLLELRAAVAISSTNAARSHAAVSLLGEQLRKSGVAVTSASLPGTEAAIAVRLSGLPVVLYIAAGPDSNGSAKFVLGVGEASVQTALHPPSVLGASAPHTTAAASLGEGIQPSLIVSFPTFLSLVEAVGLIEDQSIAKFVPYLRAATTLVGGGHELNSEVQRFRLVLGLQPAAANP